jgi:hypothetical protein
MRILMSMRLISGEIANPKGYFDCISSLMVAKLEAGVRAATYENSGGGNIQRRFSGAMVAN